MRNGTNRVEVETSHGGIPQPNGSAPRVSPPVRLRGPGGASFHNLHRYLGLTIGVVVAVLGLSGSLLVFRPELERLFHPELFSVSSASTTAAAIEDMRSMALISSPGRELYRIRLAADEKSPHVFILGIGGKFTDHVYIDPYSRRVLGVRRAGSDFFLWLQSLHFDLLAAETGRVVNGGVATALLLLSASGLVLWFRVTTKVGPRLRPRWRARPARRNWGVHVSFGFWSLPFLALMATTALYFAFHDPVAQFIHTVTRTAPLPPLPRTAPSHNRVSLDTLLSNVRALDPLGRYTLIRLPRSSGQHITFNYVLPGDLSDLGANAIHCNPSTGTVLRTDRLRDMGIGPRIIAALVPLHFGTFGGFGTRVLWACLGLVPSVLFISGFAVWRYRRLPTGRTNRIEIQRRPYLEVKH